MVGEHYVLFHDASVGSSPTGMVAISRDGSVVTWGDVYRGGNSTAVRDQLKKRDRRASHSL